jgi:hypothetical protein
MGEFSSGAKLAVAAPLAVAPKRINLSHVPMSETFRREVCDGGGGAHIMRNFKLLYK